MAETSDDAASKDARAASVERQLNDEPPPAAPRENDPGGSTPAEGTDEVGESVGRRGEDIVDDDGKEAGREDTGTEGPTDRPTGTSTARDASGVDPHEPIEGGPASPGTRS